DIDVLEIQHTPLLTLDDKSGHRAIDDPAARGVVSHPHELIELAHYALDALTVEDLLLSRVGVGLRFRRCGDHERSSDGEKQLAHHAMRLFAHVAIAEANVSSVLSFARRKPAPARRKHSPSL